MISSAREEQVASPMLNHFVASCPKHRERERDKERGRKRERERLWPMSVPWRPGSYHVMMDGRRRRRRSRRHQTDGCDFGERKRAAGASV